MKITFPIDIIYKEYINFMVGLQRLAVIKRWAFIWSCWAHYIELLFIIFYSIVDINNLALENIQERYSFRCEMLPHIVSYQNRTLFFEWRSHFSYFTTKQEQIMYRVQFMLIEPSVFFNDIIKWNKTAIMLRICWI